jgi:hypothetical protein
MLFCKSCYASFRRRSVGSGRSGCWARGFIEKKTFSREHKLRTMSAPGLPHIPLVILLYGIALNYCIAFFILFLQTIRFINTTINTPQSLASHNPCPALPCPALPCPIVPCCWPCRSLPASQPFTRRLRGCRWTGRRHGRRARIAPRPPPAVPPPSLRSLGRIWAASRAGWSGSP